MRAVEEALDLVVSVFLIAMCLAIGSTVILSAVYEDRQITERSLVDKTTPTYQGFEVDNAYDGTLSKLDVILMLQVQEYAMPAPRKFRLESPTTGEVLDIDLDKLGAYYKSEYNQYYYGNEIKRLLIGDTGSTYRYEVVLDPGLTDDKSDDFYIIRKVQ